MLQNQACKTHPVQLEFSMNTNRHEAWATEDKKGLKYEQNSLQIIFSQTSSKFLIPPIFVPCDKLKIENSEKLQVQVKRHLLKVTGWNWWFLFFWTETCLRVTCSTVTLLPFCIGGKWKPRNDIYCPWKITRNILFGIFISVFSWAIHHTSMQFGDLILSWAAFV